MSAIAVGSVFGAAALVIASLGGIWVYLRRKRGDEWRNDESGKQLIWSDQHSPYRDEEDRDRLGSHSRGATLGGASEIVATDFEGAPVGATAASHPQSSRHQYEHGEGEDGSPTSTRVPMASVSGGWGRPSRRKGITLAVLGLGRQGTSHPNDRNGERFDILADDDERELDDLGLYNVGVQRNGSSGSGASSGRPKRRSGSGKTWTSVVGESITGSIKSAGAAVQRAVSGTAAPSAAGQGSPDWWERDMEFVDTQAQLLDENGGPSNEHAIDGHVSPPSYVPESAEYLQGPVSTSETRYT